MIQVSVITSWVLRAGAAIGVVLGLREVRRTAEAAPAAANALRDWVVPVTIIAAGGLIWIVTARGRT